MIALLLLGAAAPAAASSPVPPPPAVSSVTANPAAIAEALRLLDSQGFEQEILRTSELSLEAAMVSMTAQIQKLSAGEVPAELIEQMRDLMRKHTRATMMANMQRIKLTAAQLYAEEFTTAELAHLRELAADPVMVKARAKAQVMGPKMMLLGMKTMRDAQPELEAKIKALVTDYFEKHGKADPSS